GGRGALIPAGGTLLVAGPRAPGCNKTGPPAPAAAKPAVMNPSPSASTAIASYPGRRPTHATAGRPIATAAVANASNSVMSGPATEKTDHVSDGDPVNGFRISPRRSELPEVATQKLWPATPATTPPAAF